MSMTNKAAQDIAYRTIDKYSRAHRRALIMYFMHEDDDMFEVVHNTDDWEWANCMVSALVDFLGDDFEKEMKEIIKQVKANKKGKKNGIKH